MAYRTAEGANRKVPHNQDCGIIWAPTRYYVYRGSDMWSYPRLDRAIAKARTLAEYSHNGQWTVAGEHPDYDTSYHTPTYCTVYKDGTIQLTLLATGPTDTATEASV